MDRRGPRCGDGAGRRPRSPPGLRAGAAGAPAVASLSHARRAGRRRHRSPAATPATRCSCPTGSCAGAALAIGIAFSGVGRGLDRHCCRGCRRLIASAGWRARVLDGGRSSLVLTLVAAQPAAAAPAARTSGSRPTATRRSPTPTATRIRRTSSTPAWAADRLDARPRHPHRALLVDRARLPERPLRLVRRAGAPDEVPDRDRLHARAGAPWALGLVELRGHRRPDRRSATCPTASAASGCGRCRASASRSATRALLRHALPTRPPRCSMPWSSCRACSATDWPRSTARSRAEIFQGRHYGAVFGTLSSSPAAARALGPWVAGIIHDATGSYARRLLGLRWPRARSPPSRCGSPRRVGSAQWQDVSRTPASRSSNDERRAVAPGRPWLAVVDPLYPHR